MSGRWWEYLSVFSGSALLCAVLTPLALRMAVRLRVFDHPDAHKGHETAVPYLGGAAITFAFATMVVAAAAYKPPPDGLTELVAILSVAVLLAILGLADDLWELLPVWRLAAELVAASVVWLIGGGVSITGLVAVDFALTVLWIVSITNAFNLLDNMDGLAAGLCSITCLTYFTVASANGQVLVASLSLGLAGCGWGFLGHNFHPARIYMGDSGSLFLGFLVSYLGVKLRFEGDVSVSPLVPITACAIPLLDTTLVIVSRLLNGRSPFQGGQDHISHRLVTMGLTVRRSVSTIYVCAIGSGIVSYAISKSGETLAWILAGMTALSLVFFGARLLRVPVYAVDRDVPLSVPNASE